LTQEQDNLLSDDHSEIDRLLDVIFEELYNGYLPSAYANVDYFWARLAMHIRAEHIHLFPALIKAALQTGSGSEKQTASALLIESLIVRLREDHNFFMSELAGVVKIIRFAQDTENHLLSANLVEEVKERLTNVRLRLITHNDIEETRVYPLVELTLSQNEAAEIFGRMKKELNNLPHRFINEVMTSDASA